LDASLKELDRIFRIEKERQDRLRKIQRIKKFQTCISEIKASSSKVEQSLDHPDELAEEESSSVEDEPKDSSPNTPARSATSSPFQQTGEGTSYDTEMLEKSQEEEEIVVPWVFNRKALDILAPLQKEFLVKCYPSLKFDESVPGPLQEQDSDFPLEPGVSTEEQEIASSAAIPAAPVHTSVLKKTREITHRMKAREPKGAQVLFKPPTKSRLANLVKPDVTVRRVVTMKRSFAEKAQSDLTLTNAEGVYFRDLCRNKKAPILNQHSDANKLTSAKFNNLGTIVGAANWVQILNDFVTRTLKDRQPDMAAVF
jgi:hypothetical protein